MGKVKWDVDLTVCSKRVILLTNIDTNDVEVERVTETSNVESYIVRDCTTEKFAKH